MHKMALSVLALLPLLTACSDATEPPPATAPRDASPSSSSTPTPTSTSTGAPVLPTSTATGNPGLPPPPPVPALVDEVVVRIDGPRPPGALRVTTVWLNQPPANGLTPSPTFVVGASVPVPLALAATVKIPATPPPVSARALSANGDYTALGRIFVYEDTNGNGTFDATPAASGASFVDRIVGYVGARVADPATGRESTSSYSIGYLQGAAPSGGVFAGATQGYSVIQGKETGGPVVSTVLPLSTVVPVKLVAEPALSCAGVSPLPSGGMGGLRLDNVIAAPVTSFCPGNAPLPLGAVRCTAPGLNFYVSTVSQPTSSFVRAACGEVLESCVVRSSDTVLPGPLVGARPVGWPCP